MHNFKSFENFVKEDKLNESALGITISDSVSKRKNNDLLSVVNKIDDKIKELVDEEIAKLRWAKNLDTKTFKKISKDTENKIKGK